MRQVGQPGRWRKSSLKSENNNWTKPSVTGAPASWVSARLKRSEFTPCVEAMWHLQKLSVEPLLRSSLWQTAPVDCPPGSPPFVNAVVGLAPRPEETPQSLFAKLQTLEKNSGRKPKTILNEPRPLDLDLIA